MQVYELNFEKNTLVCKQGDPSNDLFYLESGKLLVCTISGTEVKALARIEPGKFIGELAFFDGKARSSHIIALERSKIIRIPKNELTSVLPQWYLETGKSLTKKIRSLDHIIQETNIRRYSTEDQKPLTIQEQREFYSLITQ